MTINIAGIEFPDQVLIDAAAVAFRLDEIMPEVMALLDRAAASYNAIEIVATKASGLNGLTDETMDTIRDETGFGRIVHHWYELQNRTHDSELASEELEQVQRDYMDSPEGRARTAELQRQGRLG